MNNDNQPPNEEFQDPEEGSTDHLAFLPADHVKLPSL